MFFGETARIKIKMTVTRLIAIAIISREREPPQSCEND